MKVYPTHLLLCWLDCLTFIFSSLYILLLPCEINGWRGFSPFHMMPLQSAVYLTVQCLFFCCFVLCFWCMNMCVMYECLRNAPAYEHTWGGQSKMTAPFYCVLPWGRGSHWTGSSSWALCKGCLCIIQMLISVPAESSMLTGNRYNAIFMKHNPFQCLVNILLHHLVIGFKKS